MGIMFTVILACMYNARIEKKRLKKLLRQYTSTPATVRVNPIHNNSIV